MARDVNRRKLTLSQALQSQDAAITLAAGQAALFNLDGPTPPLPADPAFGFLVGVSFSSAAGIASLTWYPQTDGHGAPVHLVNLWSAAPLGRFSLPRLGGRCSIAVQVSGKGQMRFVPMLHVYAGLQEFQLLGLPAR